MALQDITSPIVVLGAYLQNFSATFGINNSPTSVNLTLVETDRNDISPYDISVGATGFNRASADPGKLVPVVISGFNFVGLVQSWEQSFSSAGRKYSVNLADPRLFFDGVRMSLNGQGLPTGIPKPSNYFNIYDYYSSPASGDQNSVGMAFGKVRDFLVATGIMNVYGYKYKLAFSSGFLDGTGVNPSGIPPWYRVPATNTSLAQLLNKVSEDFSFDYYAILTTGNFNATGISTINIVDIPRYNQGGNSLENYISGVVASGTSTEYKYGKELITDPTASVLMGPAVGYWPNINSSDVQCVWGYTTAQTAVTTALGNTGTIPILLNQIVADGRTLITSEVTVSETVLQKVTGLTDYPPTISRVTTAVDYPGYYATENILRAALWNETSWKSALHQQNPTFATELGINVDPVYTAAGFEDAVTELTIPLAKKIDIGIRWAPLATGNYYVEDLVQAVYNATRQVAETYYGKQWLVRVGSSNWLVESAAIRSTEVVPKLEFQPTQFAWSEPNKASPSGATLNYPVLQGTTREGFKDSDGKVTAFLGIGNYKSEVDPDWKFPVDLTKLDKGDYLIDQERLVVPLSVQVYEKFPSKALVTINTPLPAAAMPDTDGYFTNFSGFSGSYYDPFQGPYYEFLRFKGFTDTQIATYGLLTLQNDEQQSLGLAPRRLGCIVPINPGVEGFFVPAQSNLINYGNFVSTGSVTTPINIIEDASLAPWTYGSWENMRVAASSIIGRVNSTSYIAEFGQVRVAGYPQFNVGYPLGLNNLITNISLDYGVDGFATNYTVKTYTLAGIKLTKLLQNGGNGYLGPLNSFTNEGAVDLTKEMQEFRKQVAKERKDQLLETKNSRRIGKDKEDAVSRISKSNNFKGTQVD
jgi:hypothetical protein